MTIESRYLWYIRGAAALTIFLILFTVTYFKFSEHKHLESNSSKTIVKLNGPWKFKTGDHPQWALPGIDDSQWEAVDFTAPAGARDGDVGISGYIPGWMKHGHSHYSGYAWYRIKIPLDHIKADNLSLLAPSAVDDVYQVYVNGILQGNSGDFSKTDPTAYGIQPKMFLLPLKGEKDITIAFRVWMSSATLEQGTDLGGIHVAPELGSQNDISKKYKFQWGQLIKGYIVEIVEPVMFLLLALIIYFVNQSKSKINSGKGFIPALVLIALLRLNQAVYSWFQIESAHQYDIITSVILRPLVLGAWLLAWWEWYSLHRPQWFPKVIAVLTIVYITVQLMGLEWISRYINHLLFQDISQYIRYLFLILMLYIVISGFVNEKQKNWLALLAALLVAVGLFPQEVSLLHIPGIWFPYGVGVSRTQYFYAAFVLVMYMMLLQKQKRIIYG
ncbi:MULTISPECIES: glycoside hydrolase [Chryseobacterium]|uniref:glycoside hydrolase n=1 Tax=Chryseobacterium TaxID=59732 RepID=UPI001628164F|nr:MULTISPECIES: glycoside hydrolase [Chryseobacterium]MDM1553450.1 glycoside hydrolase [Chryseobacterium indologenes]